MLPQTATIFAEGWQLRDARPVVLAWTVAWNHGTKTVTMPWQSELTQIGHVGNGEGYGAVDPCQRANDVIDRGPLELAPWHLQEGRQGGQAQ